MQRVVVALCCLTSAVPAEDIHVSLVNRPVIENRLEAYQTKNEAREIGLRSIFQQAGCAGAQLSEQPVKGQKTPNLVCTLNGSLGAEIVVGAHFDLVDKAGDGVVDNWTGASLLPSLFEGLAGTPRRHMFRFVGFTAEENGLIGSQAYVTAAIKGHSSVSAMVNMDTLGLSETELWVSHADPKLVHWMQVAAAATKLPLSGVNVEQLGSSDSESFREKKIPAITIHSVTSETWKILHSPQDRIKAVNRDAYYRSYQLILTYLAVLDQNLD